MRISFQIRGIVIALGLLCLDARTFGTTVSQSQLSKGPSDDSCNPPAAVTGFQLSDVEVWAYFLVDGAEANDVARVEWRGPDDTIWSSDTYTPLDAAGSYCFDSYFSTAEDAYSLTPGKWTVRLLWNGSVIGVIPFQVMDVSTGAPDGLSCVSGVVDSITFSLAHKTPDIPEEVVISGQILCPTCAVQPPVFPEFVAKLEDARTTGVHVDACYDSAGAVNVLRLRPVPK